MTDTPDIEARVERLRNNQKWEKTGRNHDLAKDAADALERTQAVVEAATRYQNHHNNVNRLAMYHALATLDAPLEGEG